MDKLQNFSTFNDPSKADVSLNSNSKNDNSFQETKDGEAYGKSEIDKHLRAYLSLLNIEIENNIGARKLYARYVFILVFCWLILIAIIILLSGFQNFSLNFVTDKHIQIIFGSKFHLSDSVLIALITTTTINILSFLVLILKYIFPANSDNRLKDVLKELKKRS